jgi:hypothetical protein
MAAKKSKAEIRQVQQTINAFEKRQKLGRKPLREDGDLGIATKRRIREAKYDLGYVNSKRTVAWGDDFLHRLRHPTLVRPEWGQTKDAVKRGRRRRITRRAHVARNRVKAVTASGVTTFDGVPVAKWLKPYLVWAREHGDWHGSLNSGWRDPKYSESLCIRICGRPSCPGKCAGTSSNHVGSTPPKGAVDVSDYVAFGRAMQRCPLSPKLHNALGAQDPVHYSVSGG